MLFYFRSAFASLLVFVTADRSHSSFLFSLFFFPFRSPRPLPSLTFGCLEDQWFFNSLVMQLLLHLETKRDNVESNWDRREKDGYRRMRPEWSQIVSVEAWTAGHTSVMEPWHYLLTWKWLSQELLSGLLSKWLLLYMTHLLWVIVHWRAASLRDAEHHLVIYNPAHGSIQTVAASRKAEIYVAAVRRGCQFYA